MYGWGADDVNKWNKPGGYKYDDAKKPYLDELAATAKPASKRSYAAKIEPDLTLVDPKGRTLVSESKNPVQIVIDGTGSMQKWPAEIFDRLPLLYQTLSQYESDVELSLNVIGDATTDDWPLQVNDFGKGVDLEKHLKALHAEGRGGAGIRESYELYAYFAQQHVETPNAVNPFLIFMGDEQFYDKVDPGQVEHYLGDSLQAPMDTKELLQQIGQRFDVYFLRKPYAGRDEAIKGVWQDALGPQKVIDVYDPQRIVDVALGLIAKRWGHFDDFELNLSARQDAKGIDTVMTSLNAVDAGIGINSIVADADGSPKATESMAKSINLTAVDELPDVSKGLGGGS